MIQMMKAGFTAQGGHNIMNKQDRKLIEKMMEYYAGDPKRVQHFLKVYEFAKLIGESEELEPEKLHILRTAAIVHDIGIKISEEKYGSSGGKYQEKEGMILGREFLKDTGVDEDIAERVVYLIGHHHSPAEVDGIDYQILLEADYLVNADEGGDSTATIKNTMEHIFKTKTGTELLKSIYKLN